MRFMILTAAAVTTCAGLAACTPEPTTFSNRQQMQAQPVQFGTISSMRLVETRSVSGSAANVAGAVVGGLAGNALGRQIGNGRGSTFAGGAGTVLGAAAGVQVAQSTNQQQSSQWMVTLDNGQTIAVIQNDPSLRVGQRVAVIQDGSNTRLAPAG